MSFVGPRALAVGELSIFMQSFRQRHEVRPGLTGLAQVIASRDSSLEDKFRIDLQYINNQTFWVDIKLLFLSVWISLRGKWESRQKKI